MEIYKGRIFDDFIDQNKIQYVIPVYQRNYEWTDEECKKLYEDIITIVKVGNQHFCGSIVYSYLQEIEGVKQLVIIDGQQRLTTIFLLIKALADLGINDVDKERIECLFNKDKYDELKLSNLYKLKLKPVKTDNDEFLKLMNNKFENLKDSKIKDNYYLFKDLISNSLNNGIEIKEIFKALEKLICARIILDSNDDAQEIFERINSTGVPLNLADKIRNYVLMRTKNQDYLYQKYWLELEKFLPEEKLNTFFNDYLLFKIEGNVSDSNSYQNFKDLCINNFNDNKEDILKDLTHYAKIYSSFIYGDSLYSEDINNYLKLLRIINQTTVYLFLLNVFNDYLSNIISKEDLELTLKFIFNYIVRRTICGIRSGSLRGLFRKIYYRIFNNENNKKHYYDAIICFFKGLNTQDKIPTDDEFFNSLKYTNLYNKGPLCKILLTNIENSNKEKVAEESLTIEHILPQNRLLSTEWQKMLGSNWLEIQNKYLNTLGNLTLTSYNSEMGDKPFNYKKNIVVSSAKTVILSQEIIDSDMWNEKIIESRANRLGNILLKVYKIDEPNTIVEFKDERFSQFSFDEPNDATGKTPNYVMIEGNGFPVSTFKDVLVVVVEYLYEKDKNILNDIAINNKTLLSWTKQIHISNNPNGMKYCYRINNSNIYVKTGISASHVVYIIKELLYRYGIDSDDCYYSARITESYLKDKTTKEE